MRFWSAASCQDTSCTPASHGRLIAGPSADCSASATGALRRLCRARPSPQPTATAVLIQPNLDVGGDNDWAGPGEWDSHIAEFKRLADEQCKTYIAGIPQTGAPNGEIICPPYPTHPDLVVWPEVARALLRRRPALSAGAGRNRPARAGAAGRGQHRRGLFAEEQVARLQLRARRRRGRRARRPLRQNSPRPLRRIHSLPEPAHLRPQAHRPRLGVPRAATSARSSASTGHRYGVFICYEAVFADEVRQFAQLGAEVLVNISDDGWYGDTSAPWQHLNMARMRAIENRRWLLRDTNNGVTAVIDPYGRVRQSIPRHQSMRFPPSSASATTSPSTPRTATSLRGCAYCFRLPFSSGR